MSTEDEVVDPLTNSTDTNSTSIEMVEGNASGNEGFKFIVWGMVAFATATFIFMWIVNWIRKKLRKKQDLEVYLIEALRS